MNKYITIITTSTVLGVVIALASVIGIHFVQANSLDDTYLSHLEFKYITVDICRAIKGGGLQKTGDNSICTDPGSLKVINNYGTQYTYNPQNAGQNHD